MSLRLGSRNKWLFNHPTGMNRRWQAISQQIVGRASKPPDPRLHPAAHDGLIGERCEFLRMSAKSLHLAPLFRSGAVLSVVRIVGAGLSPVSFLPMFIALIGVPFSSLTILRCEALVLFLKGRGSKPTPSSTMDAASLPEVLPKYAVLAPLYNETRVIGQLLEGLGALDFPADRLLISLIVEAYDTPTQAAVGRHVLRPNTRVVVVPQGQPRTKPRALNYALANAIGDYVVVSDAEDLPHPNQLRDAVAVLLADPDMTGCVQARLQIYHNNRSLLARLFTIKYNERIGAILLAQEHFGMPIPLGGTSNHFPRRVLERAGGWDAHNVTKDADVGNRLARLGYEVRFVSSTAWEEAPRSLRV